MYVVLVVSLTALMCNGCTCGIRWVEKSMNWEVDDELSKKVRDGGTVARFMLQRGGGGTPEGGEKKVAKGRGQAEDAWKSF